MKVERIALDKIVSTENSRGTIGDLSSLMNSIQQHGLEHPVGVNYDNKGKYQIVYGNRRLQACEKLGWKTIPAVLYTELDDKELLIKNVIENVQRKNITPVEIGRIIEQLSFKGLTIPEISARLDMPASTIRTLFDLYKNFPEEMRNKVIFQGRGQKKNGKITVAGAAKILTMRHSFGLTRAEQRKIFEHTMVEELNREEIQLISLLMKDGLTINKAMDRAKQYKVYRLDIVALKEEIKDLASQSKCTESQYLEQIVYGQKPQLSKPSFVLLGGKNARKNN